MSNVTGMPIQHQLPTTNISTFSIEKQSCIRQASNSIATNASREPKLQSEMEGRISEIDVEFLLTTAESFGSVYRGNTTSDNLFRASNKLVTQDNSNRGIPIDEITFFRCKDSTISSKTTFDSSSFEECQNKSWMQSNVKKDDSLISDASSSDVNITNCAVLQDFAKNPITSTVSDNELEELDLDGCLSVSNKSDLGCCLSVFEESDSDNGSRSDSVDQSLSWSIKSISNEENKCRSIPTAVNSPKNCDNSTSFQTADISSRVRPYQEASWLNQYKQLRQFHAEKGHCFVPNSCPKYQKLVNWVKRQRRDYKKMNNGGKSGMSAERKHMLESIDFIWDVHDVVWREKLEALKNFRRENGNCNVPYRSNKDKQLGTWVKAQRHQYKLYREGKASSMNPHRIFLLNNLGFEWVGRSLTSKQIINRVDKEIVNK